MGQAGQRAEFDPDPRGRSRTSSGAQGRPGAPRQEGPDAAGPAITGSAASSPVASPATGTVSCGFELDLVGRLKAALNLKDLSPDLRTRTRSFLRGESEMSSEAAASLLMEIFGRTQNLEVFSLLYELTHRQILMVILKRIRYASAAVDPKDVLQDVYLSIYRYPHRFRNEKSASFRNWSFSIVRNTLLKHLRSQQRFTLDLDPLAEVVEDERARAPLRVMEEDEESERAAQTYALCLLAYRKAFQVHLKDREKKSLRLIEVKGMRYRDAAEQMGVRLENLKMIVCRARKKLLRTIEELLEVRS